MSIPEAVVSAFEAVLPPERIHSAPAELVNYSYDGTFQQAMPELVVDARTTEEVSAIIELANQHEIPIATRGAGTSLAGGPIPVGGGIVLNLAQMDRIIEVDTANSVAVVEAGVINADLQAAVEAQGLFYPPDPASQRQCSIGGNVACNAGGPRCLKYGTTKDYVIGMTVVLADGRTLRLGGKMVKNVTGYQLTQLIVGSEGTLGVVTEVTLRLLPLPSARATASAFFQSLEDAGRAVSAIIAGGILPVMLELLDGTTINVVENYAKLGLPREADAMLILEQDGTSAAACRADVDRMVEICRANGAVDVRVAESSADRDEILRARQSASGAVGQLGSKLGEDIAVPREQIPELVRRIRAASEMTGLTIAVWGHAGDGNLHPNIIFDREKEGEMERVEQAAEAILRAALDLGGTISGEHGIGTLKREFLEEDLGPEAVAVMRTIKDGLDPKGILNPHKVFPTRQGSDRKGFLTSLPTL